MKLKDYKMKLGRFELNDIYCEDCYKAIKDIPDKSIDCIYVDIPYLIKTNSGDNSRISQAVKSSMNELVGEDIVNGINYDIFNDFVRVMKNINCFIWCSKEQIYPILDWWMTNTKCTYQVLCWCKTNVLPMCNGTWLPNLEYCLYFNNGRRLNDGFENKSKFYISGTNQADKEIFKHPTIKPINFVKKHLLHTTNENDIVLDCFAGSGTTLVASADIGRQYIGFEVSPKWYKIAKDRLEKKDANGQINMFLR